MEENKKRLSAMLFVPELVFLPLVVVGILGISYWQQTAIDKTLSNIVMAGLGILLVGFRVRREYLDDELNYDNGEHLLRFWLFFLCGMAVAFVCVFLPVEGWPFLPVFVMLALFSSPVAGIVASAVLLMIPAMLGEAAVGAFFLYLLCGIFGVSLICRVDNELKVGIPILLSLLSLLVCEMADLILIAAKRPAVEDFVVPVANLIISGILLLGLIKIFSSQVTYQYRVQYLELNDTENDFLSAFKQSNREDYFHCIHTAYFCERLAAKLSMDVAALKCAAYYHKLVEQDPERMKKYKLPPFTRQILNEYMDYGNVAVKSRETAVLLCADMVVNKVQQVFREDPSAQPDYRRMIDEIFAAFEAQKSFYESNLTIRDLDIMHKTFRQENLYYDFLR
ncbi:MAG: hypothetical protein NC417_07920 [Candidatus Gastranaerophilales bacterium]|nr:hypothetical protein [Candidatus Gastranaerophilales bacterium]